ncbi:MAG: hypothetical protein P8163_20280 [Candidatus Thiodiazotropha sp.]
MKLKHFVTNKCHAGQLLAAFALMFCGVTVQAATVCYPFDKVEDKTFAPGDQKQFDKALITFYEYYNEDMQQVPDGHASVINSGIIGEPPVLSFRQILVQVVPEQRIKRVTLDYAENKGTDNNQVVNLGINNEIKSWSGTFHRMNGKKLGQKDYGGLVNISVTQQPHAEVGNWVEGTLTLEADPAQPNLPDRGISRFAVGRSSQLQIDNVCLETF